MRALIDAKGSSCRSDLPPPLERWLATGLAHCIDGPNMAAREAHTVLRFCREFYDHLHPNGTVIFVQDDPALLRGALFGMLAEQGGHFHGWARALRRTFAERPGSRHYSRPHPENGWIDHHEDVPKCCGHRLLSVAGHPMAAADAVRSRMPKT